MSARCLRRNFIIAALTLCMTLSLALAAAPASADLLYVSGMEGYTVKIAFSGWHGSTTTTAGEFNTTLNFDYNTGGYCVDLYQNAKFNSWYQVDLLPASDRLGWLEAAWLMDSFADDYLPDSSFDSSIYSDKTAKTALQLAIWAAVYNDTFTLWGDFKVLKADKNVLTLANAYLEALADAGDISASLGETYKVAFDDKYQDLMIKVPSAATPEPGTMVLFGTAAGILGFWQRRQRRRRQVKVQLTQAA